MRISAKALKKFKASHEKALLEFKEVFTFDGNEYDTRFAKYLIEYAEASLKDR